MIRVPIDITIVVVVDPSYVADDVIGQIADEVVPGCFLNRGPGCSLDYSEILEAVMTVPGVSRVEELTLIRPGIAKVAQTSNGNVQMTEVELPCLGTLQVSTRPHDAE